MGILKFFLCIVAQVSSTALIAVAWSPLFSSSIGEGGDLIGFCVRAKTNTPFLSLERVSFPFCSEDKITSFQEEKNKFCFSVILSMYIARLNFGNHCRHESQPMTEKSDQVRGFLEILALREVRKEERAGEKSFSSPEPPRRLSTKTRRLWGQGI